MWSRETGWTAPCPSLRPPPSPFPLLPPLPSPFPLLPPSSLPLPQKPGCMPSSVHLKPEEGWPVRRGFVLISASSWACLWLWTIGQCRLSFLWLCHLCKMNEGKQARERERVLLFDEIFSWELGEERETVLWCDLLRLRRSVLYELPSGSLVVSVPVLWSLAHFICVSNGLVIKLTVSYFCNRSILDRMVK